jgi:hypothetical protein
LNSIAILKNQPPACLSPASLLAVDACDLSRIRCNIGRETNVVIQGAQSPDAHWIDLAGWPEKRDVCGEKKA